IVREVVESLLPTDCTVPQQHIRLLHAMAAARRLDIREHAETRIRPIRRSEQATLHARPLDASPLLIYRRSQVVGIALASFAVQADHRMPTKIATRDNLGRGVRGHQRLTLRDEVVIGVPLVPGGLASISHSTLLLAHWRGRQAKRETGAVAQR